MPQSSVFNSAHLLGFDSIEQIFDRISRTGDEDCSSSILASAKIQTDIGRQTQEETGCRVIQGKKRLMITLDKIRQMTPSDLLSFGLSNIAYMKEVSVNGAQAIALHAANGRQLALMPDRQTAIAAAWENGLQPIVLQ